MTIRQGERAVVSAVLNEKLREREVSTSPGMLSAYFLHYSNEGQERIVSTHSSPSGRELPCMAFQDHKQSQEGWQHC